MFLRWIPWLLRMSRPGMDLSLKSIMMQRKLKVSSMKIIVIGIINVIINKIIIMKEVEDKDRVSKTMLITNVLCVEDDFMLKSPPFPDKVHYSHNLPLIPNGFHHKR